MLFYTGKGDGGVSHINGKKYPKDSLIAKALGELDELNSMLGVVRSVLKKKKIAPKLLSVQESLFILQAQIASIMVNDARCLIPDRKERETRRVIASDCS